MKSIKMNLQRWPAKMGVIALLGLMTGCAVGPKYKRPEVNSAPTFRGGSAETNSLGDWTWWQLFQDPILQRLVQMALTNNFDIRIAAARVEQARAIVAENRSFLFPQLGYQAGLGRAQNVSGGVPAPTGTSGGAFEAAGTASWEIDLWGRIRNMTEAARQQYFATDEGRRDVMTTLIADVAQSYFQLLALDQEVAIALQSTNTFGQSLKIFGERFRGGIASRLETASAEAALAAAAATVPELERQAIVVENQLSVLLGYSPTPVLRGRTLLEQETLPEIPPGLPSALLQRRPDIRQTEDLVKAANASVGVAESDFFPQLSLTALFGQATADLTTFTAGANTAYSIAAGLAGPIFQGGRLRAQYRQARAAWEESRLRYQFTVVNAFREVSDALIARQKLAVERTEQARAVNAYQEAVKVANERYVQGRASYYEVLQEQQLLFPAENTLTQIEYNQLLALVQLYKALGGGWNADSPTNGLPSR